MEDWNNECRSKTIEERKSSYSNAIKCAICLFKKNIAFIASAYSPAASSLYDYEPREGLGEYELENPWKENLYNHEDRNELVKRGTSIAYPDSNYCKLILANYNERIGILTMDTILLNKACFYYNSFCVSDSTNAIKIREHVRLLKEYCLDAQRKNEHLPVPQLLIKKGLIPSGNKCRQLIVVHNQEIVRDKEKNYYKATLQAFEKKGEMWIEVISPIKANLGINGIALPGQKREGDLMTPSGYYALPYVFGYKKDVETKMDFLIVNRDHVWVCDTSSKQYNQLIEDVSDTFKDNSKNERLLRFDHLNKYAIVIDYNTKPVVKGKGSAIFIHVERASFHKTAGCISIPEESIVDLIRWLDPSMFPHIYITKKIDSKENGR
jgi:L,D-peptidoglycan transpeptidase YkuD (ErfK/YbiS/YcfS/YnhG family)